MKNTLEAIRPGRKMCVDSSVTIVQRTEELDVDELATLVELAGMDLTPIKLTSGTHKMRFSIPGGSGKSQIHEIPIGKGNIGIVFPGSPEIGLILTAEPEQRIATIARAQAEVLTNETDRRLFEASGLNIRAGAARRNGDVAKDEELTAERNRLLGQATSANYGAMAARRRAEAAEANVRSILGITQEPDLI